MDDPAEAKIAQMRRVADAMRNAVAYGANAYANGTAGEKPIVDRHFTAGNQQRYGWQPLARSYFLRKSGHITGKVRRGVYYPGGGKTGSKLDPHAEFQSGTGLLVGIGQALNAPMLVLTGKLRTAVVGPRHQIQLSGDVATIRFAGLPDYALYLQDGTSRMPKRSPVDPNEADRVEVIAAMRRYMDAALGTGGSVPQSRGTVPGKARMV